MKLMRWKLAYIFLFIFLIFQTNMVLANNIVVPHEWYRYQGASDSDKKGNDCGPASVAMAIQFIKNTFVPIRDIRNYIGPNTATSEKLKTSLQHWGISYTHLSAGAQNVIDAVNDRNHIVICPVAMLCFSPGLDIDSESDDDPALHYDRYCSFTEELQGHFIVVKGISDDGNWIIVYDPGVWGSYPYSKYWYSNGEPKGKERYYKLSEFSNAINSRGIEILPEPHPIITSPLKITSDPPYYVGDTINAEFSITNKNTTPITFTVLTVGGRDPNNHVSDFTIRQNITLEPSEPYNYQGTLTLNKVGDYHFFCTYQTPDGNWNTNVDLGVELVDEDRTEEIVVIARESEDTPSVSLGYPEKILPVKPRIIGKPAPGYYISQILAKPDEIKIFGNYSKINNLEFLETIPINVSGITKTLSVKVPPALNEGLNIVEGKTTLIEVTIQVKEALVQKTLPLKEEVTEVSSSENYFPLEEGRRWEYQVYVNEKEGLYLGLESKISGKQVCTILPQRELKGKRVTPMQIEDIYRGSTYTRFLFYVKDQNSIYEFASQKPEDVEPKIIHDDIIKYPIKVGNSWQEMETSSLEPRISVPINTTIESIDEVVTVPAGTFKKCLKIKSTGFAEKVFGEEQVWPPKENVKVEKERYDWFAPNVGHIKIILKEKKTYSGGAIGITLSDYIEVIMQLETFK